MSLSSKLLKTLQSQAPTGLGTLVNHRTTKNAIEMKPFVREIQLLFTCIHLANAIFSGRAHTVKTFAQALRDKFRTGDPNVLIDNVHIKDLSLSALLKMRIWMQLQYVANETHGNQLTPIKHSRSQHMNLGAHELRPLFCKIHNYFSEEAAQFIEP